MRFIFLVVTASVVSISAALLFIAIGHNFVVHRYGSQQMTPLSVRVGGQVFAIILFFCLPLLIIWLASRLVTRPLKRFSEAIQTLQANDYKVHIKHSKITEFDRVIDNFNELIDRLRSEEDLRKDLISDTSHELNTPLTALIGQLTAIQEGKLPMDAAHVYVLKAQAERLGELVAQLDAYARARMPASEKTEQVALKRLCEHTTQEVALQLQDKGLTVHIAVENDLAVAASRKALQQVLLNLLQNALRYSGASEVTITADAHMLTFSDNGKGVPEQSLPHLFERFYRVDKSRSRETGGLGLGLAIVKELVQQQGWTIHADTAHPGLAFVIRFDT